MSDLSIVRVGAHYYASDDPNVLAATTVVASLDGVDLDAAGITVAPQEENRIMDPKLVDVPADHIIHELLPGRRHRVVVESPLPPTCAMCGIPTPRVVRDAPEIHACGYHGGVEPEEAN